jgi:hypothetical protein
MTGLERRRTRQSQRSAFDLKGYQLGLDIKPSSSSLNYRRLHIDAVVGLAVADAASLGWPA